MSSACRGLIEPETRGFLAFAVRNSRILEALGIVFPPNLLVQSSDGNSPRIPDRSKPQHHIVRSPAEAAVVSQFEFRLRGRSGVKMMRCYFKSACSSPDTQPNT